MRFVALLATALVLGVSAPALADPQDIANDISREMVSPFCPGITLHDCPSDSSHDLRRRITAWAEDGMSKDQIWQRLEDEYGSDIRAIPSTSGSGLWAWVMPIGAGVAGLALLVFLTTRWSRKPKDQASDEGGIEPTPEQRRRLDVELAALRDQQS